MLGCGITLQESRPLQAHNIHSGPFGAASMASHPKARNAELCALVPTVVIKLRSPPKVGPSWGAAAAGTRAQTEPPRWRDYYLGANAMEGAQNSPGGNPAKARRQPKVRTPSHRSPGRSSPVWKFAEDPAANSLEVEETGSDLEKWSLNAVSGATYNLPPLFRSASAGSSLASAFNPDKSEAGASAFMLHSEAEAAWAALVTGGSSEQGQVVAREYALAALADLWPELPRLVFDAAINHCRAHPVGAAYIDQRRAVDSKSFTFLAHFLGRFMKCWFLCGELHACLSVVALLPAATLSPTYQIQCLYPAKSLTDPALAMLQTA